MDLNMNNKVVVVTGGSEGIGRAIALRFLQEGCNVAVMARRPGPIEAFCRECEGRGFGGRIFGAPADVASPATVAAFLDAVTERFGRLDVWVNNAGRAYYVGLNDITDEEWDECLAINLTGVFHCCRLAARAMRATGGGVIINASSFSAYIPTAGIGAYAVAKRGLSALTQVLAAELAPDNIRVVSFAPGLTETPMASDRIEAEREHLARQIPAKRIALPDDIAPAVVFLASDCANYITGTDLVVAGGKFCVQNPMYAWES